MYTELSDFLLIVAMGFAAAGCFYGARLCLIAASIQRHIHKLERRIEQLESGR